MQKYCPARDLAIALSVRKMDTSCPLVVAGGGWGRNYTRPLPLDVKKYVVVAGLMYSTSITVVILSLAKVHECMQKFIC